MKIGIGIGIAAGIIFLIAASANLAMSGVGEPETHIDIYVDETTGMNIIKYTNFEVYDDIEIYFDRTIGSDKLDRTLKSEISQTDGYGYHVGIGCTNIENGECFDLPPGPSNVDARGWLNDEVEYTAKGTIEVEK
jgi:hypothetical protein